MIEFEAPDWHALHSSLNRRRRFAFCPVGYYLYHVPGRDGYNNQPEDWHWLLYCAKHAVAPRSWIRQLFRRAVREYFCPGEDFRRRKFINFVRTALERDFALLESGAELADPKVVNALIGSGRDGFSLYGFYDQAVWDLERMSAALMETALFEELLKLPITAFRSTADAFRWQLGGVEFTAVPDLVWAHNNQLNVLDMNSYDYPEERSRQAELFRVYIYSFMQIAPASAVVHHWDPDVLRLEKVPVSEEDFSQVFRQLAGEAAMWRDHLIHQAEAAPRGEWLFAQFEKCAVCRFAGLCPAGNGTAEPENCSIIPREDFY